MKTFTKQKKFLSFFALLLMFGQMNAAYFWQVSSIISFTGSATYTQGSPANPLVLSIQQCAGGISLPNNSTVYNQTLYMNTINSTVGGTVVTSNVIGTPYNFAPTYSYTPSTTTVGTLYYYYMLTSPSMTTCGFTGTLTSGIATVVVNAAIPGEALNFAGTSVVNAGTAITTSLNPATALTAEAWVNPTNTTFNGEIVGNYNAPANNMQFLLRRDGNYYNFLINCGAGYQGVQSAAGTATTGVWQHVAGVWNGNTATIYINGIPVATNTTAVGSLSAAACTNSVVIGYENAGSGEIFTGSIDEVRVWNVARTRCQINTYMGCEIPTGASGLLANYHFNQGVASGNNAGVTTLNDASGNSYNGTLSAFTLSGATSNWVAPGGVVSGFTTALAPPAVSFTANPSLFVCSGNTVSLSGTGANTYTWTGGITNATAFTPTASANYTVTGTNTITSCFNSAVASVTSSACAPAAALNFVSTTSADNVTLPTAITTNSFIGGSKFTIEAWVRPTTLTGNGCIIGNYGTPNNNLHFLLRRNGSSYLFLAGSGSTGAYAGVTSAANTATINTWQHVAGVYDGTVVTIYINGVFTTSNSVTSYTFGATTNTITLGGNSISENFDGDIDEVRIWNTTRTRCQINTYMNCEIPSSATNLVANYHFNQGVAGNPNPTVTGLTDASGNAFNGTLNTFALNGATSNWVAPGGVVSGFTTALAPPAVNAVTSNTLLCTGQTATLTASGAATYVWNTSATTSAIAVSPTVTTNYTVTGTAANTCTNTAMITQSVSACTGIESLNASASEIVIYPNPSNGVYNVSLTSTALVKVMNVVGQEVYNQTLTEGVQKIDLSHVNDGVYFATIEISGTTRIIRLIKQ